MSGVITEEYELVLGFDDPPVEKEQQTDSPSTTTSKRSRRKKAEQRPTKAEIVEAIEKAEKIRSRRKKATEESTIPVPRKVIIPNRVEEIWTDLQLKTKDGFYEVADGDKVRERGVIGITYTATGPVEQRVPFEAIKGLFRSQYVSDMQAADPLILGANYMIYVDGPVAFLYIDQQQFEAIDKMMGSHVSRCYTYHDLADNKRGYTFSFPEFPSRKDQEEYLNGLTPVRRRELGETKDEQEEAVEEAAEASAEDMGADPDQALVSEE